MKFRSEWDAQKASAQFAKHLVSFEEAASVFNDPLVYTFPDPDHSVVEQRQLSFGMSSAGRILADIATERTGVLRIISARKATRHERGIYEQG